MENRKEVDTDLQIGGTDYSVTFTRVSKLSIENWGADADGNRGIRRTSIDEDYADNVRVNDIPIEKCPLLFQALAEKAIDTWLNKNEVEIDEDKYSCDE